LIAALVLFAYGRRIIAENEKAHKEITENVQENQQRITALDTKIDTVAKDLDTKIDTVAQTLAAVAKDVSFLAGRQAERDRATEA
jgi:uncharacterized protein YoxC